MLNRQQFDPLALTGEHTIDDSGRSMDVERSARHIDIGGRRFPAMHVPTKFEGEYRTIGYSYVPTESGWTAVVSHSKYHGTAVGLHAGEALGVRPVAADDNCSQLESDQPWVKDGPWQEVGWVTDLNEEGAAAAIDKIAQMPAPSFTPTRGGTMALIEATEKKAQRNNKHWRNSRGQQ